MTAGAKLAIGAAVIVTVTAYMAYVGASSSWRYYLTTDECVAEFARFVGEQVRVSGRVAKGSLEVDAGRSQARFTLVGRRQRLEAVCSGRLPDNLGEGAEVVVEGRLTADGRLQGDKVLTRCASKYEARSTPVCGPDGVGSAGTQCATKEKGGSARASLRTTPAGEAKEIR